MTDVPADRPKFPVRLEMNGEKVAGAVLPDETLLEWLRDRGCTSVRGSCGIGICGTCTVLVNERTVSSCIALAGDVDGARVRTAETMEDDEILQKTREAFVDNSAFQCSYCIPGMVLSVNACIEQNPDCSSEDVREFLGGNLCRCGTYPQVLDVIRDLTREKRR